MSDSNVQPLEKISTEVVESQFKIILSSQCIKAQAFLVQKLRKQSEQTKQICTFISNGNFKLENEIRLGELEVQSLLSALETIRSANVELKKELLLSKEEKKDLTERVETGIKKYEELWITSKKRYDNIPLIKEKLQIENKGITLDNNIKSLDWEIKNLMDALDTRKNELINLDKNNIINIAEYMTHERPKLLQYIKEKKVEINNLMREINELQHKQDNNKNPLKKVFDITMNESPCVMENKKNDNEIKETVLLPKLQLQNIDLDILTDKLKQKSQEKKVTFDKVLVQDIDTNNINITQEEITSSQLNTCSGNDNTYNKIKENIFKKHNLELTPEITYSKNPVVPKAYTSVTSKFFDATNNTKDQELVDVNRETTVSEVTGPPENINVDGKQVQNSSVAGFLFTHGSKGLPELLDMSMTSTCIDESDEFPHCIDSTLLLSPKADEVMSASGDKNAKELSQEVPNFLSGFRKVGFSFFGNSSSEKKTDSNNKNANTDFNFNFGNTEKKSRGGLFNMFN